MRSPTAIVLLAHGSPDPDWSRPIVALAKGLRELRPGVTVLPAYLGHLDPSLGDALEHLHAQGCTRVLVLAAFLSPGGRHIKQDVPRVVAQQAARFPELTVVLRPGALGADAEVIGALASAASRALEDPP